jgi:hypothetical protein
VIYLPGLKHWINLDLVQYAVHGNLPYSNTQALLVVFNLVQGQGMNAVYVTDESDQKILEEALNARCAEEAGEEFLP